MTLKDIHEMLKKSDEQRHMAYMCPDCGGYGILLYESETGWCTDCKASREAHIVVMTRIFFDNARKKHMN